MNVSVGFGLLLVIVGVVLLAVAGLLINFDTTNTKAYFELLAFGGACGFLGLKLP